MTRGTFANVRIKNLMVPGVEGGVTGGFTAPPQQGRRTSRRPRRTGRPRRPSEAVVPIYDAAEKYKAQSVPLIVIGGEDYGMGSSRDWAAKGTNLLGVKAVITKSFERIHRSNLVGMGVLPCNFMNKADYDNVKELADATFDLLGVSNQIKPKAIATLRVHRNPASVGADTPASFDVPVVVRLDTPVEIDYYRAGGILPYVLAQLLRRRDMA